jgi:putative transposase
VYKVYIDVGVIFKLNNQTWQIVEKLDNDTFKVKNLEFENVEKSYSRWELFELLEQGHLEFAIKGKNTVATKKIEAYDDIDNLPKKVKVEIKRRYRIIEPLINIDGSLRKYIEARANDEDVDASVQSIYRYLKMYKDGYEDKRALIPGNFEHGVKGSRLQHEVENIINDILDNENNYFTREKKNIKSMTELVKAEIIKRNKGRDEDKKLIAPDESTIRRRIIDKLDFDAWEALNGKTEANKKRRQTKMGVRPSYPLERVEMDHTKLDLFVLDKDRNIVLGRPWITTALDIYTRYPLGVYIGFEPPSYKSVMHCLIHAIQPKTYVKEKYPKVRNQWLAYGIPETLVVDNGKEFHSKSFIDATSEIGTKVQYCPVKVPWYKGSMERWFGTINTNLLHQTPGTSFSNIFERKDYNPEKNAVVTFERFLELFHKWLLDYYVIGEHGEQRCVPYLAWNDYFKVNPLPPVPYKTLDWKIKLMKVETRSIQHTGIRMNYLYYSGDILTKITEDNLRYDQTPEVKFKYDPTNLGYIYVYDEKDKRYHKVPCTNMEYADGLNEYTHRLILQKITKETKEKVDKDALAIAKAELFEMIDEEKESNKKQRNRHARINVGSDTVFDSSSTSTDDEIIDVEAEEVEIVVDIESEEEETSEFNLDEVDFDENDWEVIV